MRRFLLETEIMIALRLGALGQAWAASAAHRLRKLSGEPSAKSALK